MEDRRSDPDELLRAIQNERASEKSGQLKIFFGYAAGVGKTYTMLKAAHAAKRRGVDVAVGYIEPHTRPETTDLLKGLPALPPKQIVYRNIHLLEFRMFQCHICLRTAKITILIPTMWTKSFGKR